MLDVQPKGEVRVLGPRDLPAVAEVFAADPMVNVFVEAHVREAGNDLSGLNAELWGYHDAHGRLVSVAYAGSNLVPASATFDAVRAFGLRARQAGRNCSSMWGRREVVEPLWRIVAPTWGQPRAIRAEQPFLILDRPPAIAPDPLVRRAGRSELEAVYRASVAFFTEELGISPEERGNGYRNRVRSILSRGRTFVRMENGEVVFKADIGVATPRAFQIQGVWVRPDRRGTGLAAAAVASVVAMGMRDVAPVATLYVNDYNVAARRAYARVGFRPVASFMTVLF